MPQYRITPSLLDDFRLFYEADFMTLQKLESRIKREPITPTPAMLLGAAFHKIAEQSPDVERAGELYSIDGLLFDRESVDDALEPLKDGISEVWCSRVLKHVPHAPLLRGRVDRIVGATPWEIKTKDKDFDPEYYAASLQWQCYTHMLDVEECRYLLIRLEEGDDCWRVKYADPLPLFRYCEMEDHLNEWATRLIRFCEDRGLLQHLILKEA